MNTHICARAKSNAIAKQELIYQAHRKWNMDLETMNLKKHVFGNHCEAYFHIIKVLLEGGLSALESVRLSTHV